MFVLPIAGIEPCWSEHSAAIAADVHFQHVVLMSSMMGDYYRWGFSPNGVSPLMQSFTLRQLVTSPMAGL